MTIATDMSYLAEHEGAPCAGVHLIIDLKEVEPGILRDKQLIERVFRECVRVSGATLLHMHVHVFEQGGGISGVAVLAESHISVHTWPEIEFAAFDVFMCGKANPYACVDVLQSMLRPGRKTVTVHARGADL
ncbi:MAG: adenosylmethionine decarboxylase [Candidatus Paceibacterota bacterium]